MGIAELIVEHALDNADNIFSPASSTWEFYEQSGQGRRK
jgi:hypothetical protein